MNNAMNIRDANYSFKIISENKNDLFPISGELYIKKQIPNTPKNRVR